MDKAILVLEDGTYFSGLSIGAKGEAFGEVVFNTCMTGYQEILTDPSYRGQMIVMTYPLIGNYGLNDYDRESPKPQAEGLIVKEACTGYSGTRPQYSLDEYLRANGVAGITGIDTRALTKHIRQSGSMYGMISTNTGHVDVLLEAIKEKTARKRQLVGEVSVRQPIYIPGTGKKIALIDFGCKENIIRNLKSLDCEIYILPYDISYKRVIELGPDGIMLSNGPGDPSDLGPSIENIRSLIGKKPIWGICMGHQLLGLALGGRTYKLKFGHHGGNHAVKDLERNKCYITSQNHNYALADEVPDGLIITEINVNDRTIEGFRHRDLPVRAVQYHPEAGPGPNDTNSFFKEFIASV